jgi:hypothetical protein
LLDWGLIPFTAILKLCWKIIKMPFAKKTIPERT